MITKSVADRFKKMLQEHRFYEAHEVLEEFWYPKRFDDDNEVKLLKGLINAAVSFELMKKGRLESSKKVWRNYLKYRQLLFKINSKNINIYNDLIRYLDYFKQTL